ncbi:hypothetical protein M405DRAFT_937052, partial [Rhizopogon salebrosus TDB-379]
VTPWLPCLAHPDHKHTSLPHPHLPSRGHPSLSAGEERRGSSVINGLSGPRCEE